MIVKLQVDEALRLLGTEYDEVFDKLIKTINLKEKPICVSSEVQINLSKEQIESIIDILTEKIFCYNKNLLDRVIIENLKSIIKKFRTDEYIKNTYTKLEDLSMDDKTLIAKAKEILNQLRNEGFSEKDIDGVISALMIERED